MDNSYSDHIVICYKCGKDYQEKNGLIDKICPICSNRFRTFKSDNNTYCSRQCYLNDKKIEFRSGGKGGIRKGSNKKSKGWYKGCWCGSSWELAYIIYNMEHDIKFERNDSEGFEYEYQNKRCHYFPDFKLDDKTYVEIKGFMRDRDLYKIKDFPHKLIIMEKDDMKHILSYVIDKYGKDFIKLYEKENQP